MNNARKMRIAGSIAAAAIAAASLAACSSGGPGDDASGGPSGTALEQTSIDIGLTGIGSPSNAPLYVAQALGYFKDEGLDVNITALPGGSNAIQSLITNTVQATTNEYVHTLQAQQQSQSIESVTVFSAAPTYALAVTKGNFDLTAKDLDQVDIGVVSLGGSTEDLINYVFETNGLDPAKARLIALGAGQSQTTAVQAQQVAALIATEPTLTTGLNDGDLKLLIDFRDPAQVKQVFGGDAPFWSLLVSNDFAKTKPNTTQALVSAVVKALGWIRSHSTSEVVDELPADVFYPSGDRATFEQIFGGIVDGFTPDGLMPEGGPDRIADYLKVAHPDTDLNALDLSASYDDAFAKKAASN